MDRSWESWFEKGRESLVDQGLLRELRAFKARDGLRGELHGRPVVLFSSNDYLGLSFHPEVRAAAADAAAALGMGPRGASLVCGYTEQHEALEADLARLAGAESALVFPTGYAANLSVLSALAEPGTAFFSDELNHASIIDGCRLARQRGARVQVYRHADAGHLEDLLRATEATRRLIVTDAVFSMDGDPAPLEEIVDLKRRHDALLAIDEAHAMLVLGASGGGLAEQLDVLPDADVRIGTLGKAIGAHGGFVASSRAVREHLVNRGRPFIYSTALPVPAVAAARAALEVHRGDSTLRARLDDHRDRLGHALRVRSTSAIHKVVLGKEKAAIEASERLLADGWLVPAMRPPTVASGTARLRVTLSAAHTADEVAGLLRSLENL